MEIETEINKVMEAISSFKINMCSMKKLEGCIICYSYPGKEDWNKKNTLTTNFCEECNVVLCSDCYKKIDGYKCPICHKQSHLINKHRHRQERQVYEEIQTRAITGQERQERRVSQIQEFLGGYVQETERRDHSVAGETIRWNNVDITSYQRTPQENRRLRNQRYRQRKRNRRNTETQSSFVNEPNERDSSSQINQSNLVDYDISGITISRINISSNFEPRIGDVNYIPTRSAPHSH